MKIQIYVTEKCVQVRYAKVSVTCAHLAAMSQSHVHRVSDPMHVVIVYDLSYMRYNTNEYHYFR
jgi:hypothetical protein